MIYAAASFAPVLTALVKSPECPEAMREARIVIGGSAALARQIEAGAPADVFVSADQDWMDWAMARNLVLPGTRTVLAGNALVLIAGAAAGPVPAPSDGFDLAGALGTGRLAMGHADTVPVGRYARQALQALGVWDLVKHRTAATDHVGMVVTLVSRGEAPLGIVYATDVAHVPTVRVVGTFPAGSHAPIAYHAAAMANHRHPRARDIVMALTSPTAQRVYAAHGYLPAQ